jgi:hypothetical protein
LWQNLRGHAKDKDLFNPHEFLFGLNITQCAVGDFELYTMYCISERQAVTLGAGYDLNFLDFGRHLDVEGQAEVPSEGNSNDGGRYFWGQGPSFRLNYDFAFSSSRDNQNKFVSVSAIVKMRNYSEYYFGKGYSHSESADQMIYGVTGCIGKNIRWDMIMMRLYTGVGFRHLQSKVHWPEIPPSIPSEDFTYNLNIPSLEFGVALFFTTKSQR